MQEKHPMRILYLIVPIALTLSAQTPPGAPATSLDTIVVATVAGQDLTAADIRKILDNAPSPQLVTLYQRDPKAAIQQFFIMKHLAAEGDKLKLGERSPLKEQLEVIRANVVAQ